MDRKNIIYIGIGSLACLTISYYAYKSPSNLPKDGDSSKSLDQPNYPSFTLSKGALEQASRVPEDQDESDTSEDETNDDEDELNEEDLETFFEDWNIQRNSLGNVTSVTSPSKEKNLPLPDAESQAASVLLWAQQVVPMFGGSANQINSSPQVTGTDLMRHYFFKQVIDIYEVHEKYLQVSVNQDGGSVFSVNNSIKEVDTQNFNLDVQKQACSNYNRQQAWQRAWQHVKDKFPSSTITDITMTDSTIEEYERPQLFVKDSVQELAWIFSVKLTGNQSDSRHILIGCISKEPLYDMSRIVY